ncbi:hypothetical protein [Marinobacter sp. MDS2]|uniref:hypothetical protein n=1 Tax=Marinobacter sp. MDS2 TaxID=3065961 RepID=UPI00273B8542|nr:hypothetical protein [Marinobacter sp. MDS2]MDP4547381.1 hypothetical protein [Marinobacter sp. MDS2]
MWKKNKSASLSAKALLSSDLSPLWLQVYQAPIQLMERELELLINQESLPDGVSHERWLAQEVCFFLIYRADQLLKTIERTDREFQDYWGRIQRAATAAEKGHHILACARYLGQSRRGLRGDQRALSRYFDENALKDRFIKQLAEQERRLAFTLNRLTVNTRRFLAEYGNASVHSVFSNRVNQVNLVERLTSYSGDYRIVMETLDWLATFIRQAGPQASALLDPQLIHYCYRLLSDHSQPVWLQTNACQIALELDTESALIILERRFRHPSEGDSIFFRARALQALSPHQNQPLTLKILALAVGDPSEHVRQTLITTLPELIPSLMVETLENLNQQEQSETVRAFLMRHLVHLTHVPALQNHVLEIALAHLTVEQPRRILREVLSALPACMAAMNSESWPQTTIERAINELHATHPSTQVRRWAAQCREHLWAISDAHTAEAPNRAHLQTLDWRKGIKLRLPKTLSDDTLGRRLAHQAKDQFGFDVHRRNHTARIVGGSGYQFRLWRFLHELFNSATDKRQNHNHTKGRTYRGLIQAPGWHIAELSQTKVPGEPLHIAEEGSWRPYLPLLDQVISSLDQGWPTLPMSIYTSEGITRIHPPRGLLARLRAKLVISLRFKDLSYNRNWRESSGAAPDNYLKQLTRLGFRFEITGYQSENGEQTPVDPRVKRFFPASFALPLPMLWEDFRTYFFSVYENSLQQLLMFFVVISAFFFGRHFYQGHRMRQARRSIPLVIGGWGTRGKSGTERLKAALFNAKGLSVLSKTTGCEAMFLYSPANRPLREMFLFRPFDKASIWEQVDLVRLSARFKADVFLWECMGLTPRYVQILQEQWMRDDLSTVTNCYPDHEDLQGPAGIDIPQVMQRFIPKNSRVITTEHNMFPFLAEGARRKGSEIIKVEESEGDLLPADVLERFPYEEHPTNIALVMRMARELGIEEDFAVKEMADRVVADLGVLKVYPVAPVQQRRLRFINGMSANERHAALANWERLKLTELSLEEQPEQWIATVVNNRADRIPRSQVFARMIAEEISADRHFLIGSNLEGLKSYIDEAWSNRLSNLDIENGNNEQVIDTVQSLVKQLRVPASTASVRGRLLAMLKIPDSSLPAQVKDASLLSPETLKALLSEHGVEIDAEPTQVALAQYERDLRELNEYRALVDELQQGKHRAGQRDGVFERLTQWFHERIIVIWDFHASGDEVIQTITENTPPGLLSHIMGMQNIKGTGLDFVYRWQAWDTNHELAQALLTADTSKSLEAARALSAQEEFGPLDFEFVSQTLREAIERRENQVEAIQAEIAVVQSRIAQKQQSSIIESKLANQGSAFKSKVIAMLEALLDAGAAVKRRKRANRIYNDLATQRISHERAVLELKKINKEQKGGWLQERWK